MWCHRFGLQTVQSLNFLQHVCPAKHKANLSAAIICMYKRWVCVQNSAQYGCCHHVATLISTKWAVTDETRCCSVRRSRNSWLFLQYLVMIRSDTLRLTHLHNLGLCSVAVQVLRRLWLIKQRNYLKTISSFSNWLPQQAAPLKLRVCRISYNTGAITCVVVETKHYFHYLLLFFISSVGVWSKMPCLTSSFTKISSLNSNKLSTVPF